jgi:hypothetical protein
MKPGTSSLSVLTIPHPGEALVMALEWRAMRQTQRSRSFKPL